MTDVSHRFFERVYALVSQIPSGQVATYGQIAHLLGAPRAARAVGYALAHLPSDTRIPWQRVVNQQGRVSPRGIGTLPGDRQRALLEQEGLGFDAEGRLDLRRLRWEGPPA
ncbi:MAG TPA: methylated-DNA--[protein]-cysteine S-methyltransferase [Pantanalinema sp.]